MQMSFLPGELVLKKESDGMYLITVKGEEVFKGKNEKKAVSEYNKIRREMEAQFPPNPATLTEEEKARIIANVIGSQFHSNTFKPPKQEKKPKGSTRTFG